MVFWGSQEEQLCTVLGNCRQLLEAIGKSGAKCYKRFRHLHPGPYPIPAHQWPMLVAFSFFYFAFFLQKVSLCSHGCPGTHFVDQVGLKLTDPPGSASKGVHRRCPASPPLGGGGGRLSHSPSCTSTYYVVNDDLEFLMLLVPSPKC